MLTQDRMTPSRAGLAIAFAIAAGEEIFAGSLVALNATGYLVSGATATGLTYLGRADAHVDNTDGADGDQEVVVSRGPAFLWKNADADPIGQALVGKTCYILDDETVAATDAAGTRSAAGTVLAIEDAGVWVE